MLLRERIEQLEGSIINLRGFQRQAKLRFVYSADYKALPYAFDRTGVASSLNFCIYNDKDCPRQSSQEAHGAGIPCPFTQGGQMEKNKKFIIDALHAVLSPQKR